MKKKKTKFKIIYQRNHQQFKIDLLNYMGLLLREVKFKKNKKDNKAKIRDK